MYVEYRITNLAQLLEAVEAIITEVREAEEASSIDPAEILLGSREEMHVTLTLKSHTLTDFSKVYDVEAN